MQVAKRREFFSSINHGFPKKQIFMQMFKLLIKKIKIAKKIIDKNLKQERFVQFLHITSDLLRNSFLKPINNVDIS